MGKISQSSPDAFQARRARTHLSRSSLCATCFEIKLLAELCHGNIYLGWKQMDVASGRVRRWVANWRRESDDDDDARCLGKLYTKSKNKYISKPRVCCATVGKTGRYNSCFGKKKKMINFFHLFWVEKFVCFFFYNTCEDAVLQLF